MGKNLFIFNFKNIPAALCLTVVVLFSVEILCRQNLHYLANTGDYMLIYKRRHLASREKPYYNAILLGDSRAMGIDTRYLGEKISNDLDKEFRVYNYAIPGFGIQGYYTLLRKYLKYNRKPEYVLIVLRPLLLAGHVDIEKNASQTHKHRFFLFFSMTDYFDVLSTKTFIETVPLEAERASYLLTYRLEIRKLLLKLFNRQPVRTKVKTNLIEQRNGGYPYSFGRKSTPSEAQIVNSIYWEKEFFVDKDALFWYDKLLQLASDNGIKVVVFNTPQIQQIYDRRENNGSNARYRDTMKQIETKYTNVRILRPLLEPFKETCFVDADHLNDEGNKVFGDMLYDRMVIPF